MKHRRALVTGIGGFAGGFLAEHLLTWGWELYGTVHCRGLDQPWSGRCETLAVDLRDRDEVARVLQACKPDVIFHLAGKTSDAESFRDPEGTMAVNVLGTLHVLEAARSLETGCRVVLAGSSAVYGRAPECDQPIAETVPHRPLSPYGTSKAAQALLGRQYVDAYGLDVVIAIPFNHTGPRQQPEAALPAFARQIAAAEKGCGPPTMLVGDLSARRDILDVRDVARAYALLAEHGRPGEAYNICSGHGCTMAELLDRLLAMQRGSALTVQTDPARVRPASIPVQVGDNAKLRAATGWKPRIEMDETLQALLAYWRR